MDDELMISASLYGEGFAGSVKQDIYLPFSWLNCDHTFISLWVW